MCLEKFEVLRIVRIPPARREMALKGCQTKPAKTCRQCTKEKEEVNVRKGRKFTENIEFYESWLESELPGYATKKTYRLMIRILG